MPAISSIILATGLGLAAGGAYMSYNAAQKAGDANAGIAQQEMLADKQREKQMELDARRKMLETVRTAQRTRSLALSTATAQNAQLGTGLMGGYGQIAGQTGNDYLGISQNLEIGRNIFDINAQINMYKMQLASAQTQSALGSGLTSLGGSFMSAGTTASNLWGGTSYGFGRAPMSYPQQLSGMGVRGGIY